jgi:hypothetical protein
MTRRKRQTSQAWIELVADDPEAVSAFTVARRRLAAAGRLTTLRRFRLFELSGELPARGAQEEMLHRSTQFYNPIKERCTVRARPHDPLPLAAGERLVLVSEREGERRPAAERWWRHETGVPIEVREAIVWALGFEPGSDGVAETRELARVMDRRHGLFCNPHSQDARLAAGEPPLPWMSAAEGER